MPFMAIFQPYLIGIFRLIKSNEARRLGRASECWLERCKHPVAPLGQCCANCSESAHTVFLDEW